jgi:hypothetical protein
MAQSLLDLLREEDAAPATKKSVPRATAPSKKPAKKAKEEPKAPTPTAINLEEDSEAPAANISEAVALAQDCLDIEMQIEKLEEQIKQKKEVLRKKAEEQLPELMTSLNLRTFSLSDGTKIEIKPFYSASIPPPKAVDKTTDPPERAEKLRRREACLEWLRKNGGEAMIKSEIVVEFPKGQDRQATRFFQDCKTSGFAATKDVVVNANSLTAFVKEIIETGKKDIPHDIFGIYVGKQAKFISPKK